MLLALDMGNTNITLGVFRGKSLLMESRIATDRKKMEDQYAVELQDILSLYDIPLEGITGAIISSVVPPLNHVLMRAVKKITGKDALLVGPGTKTGIDIRIDNPAQLGADLLVGAVAAVHDYGAPCIIWDLGTATTVSVIDENGTFLGGAIMAGVGTSFSSLTANTSLLPSISMEAPEHAIGRNTIDSMQSGAVFGTAAMLDGMTQRIQNELLHSAVVVATGGLGKVVVQHCTQTIQYDDDLLMKGLRLIYERNQSKKE